MNRRRNDAGYSLIELIVSLTILATITGALTATFLTANNANANVSERLHESTDAQLTAGFFTRDGQNAGGTNPQTGRPDAGFGVSTDDAAGCDLGGASLVVRFKWREWTGRTNGHDNYRSRVANYVYRASGNELERRTCADGTIDGVVTVATRVAFAPAITCDPNACPPQPNTVTMRVTETNNPSTNTGGPYAFSLTATVRLGVQGTQDYTNALSYPLLALGGTCSGSGASGLDLAGNASVTVNGQTVIDATDSGGGACNAMSIQGNNASYSATGTSFVSGGSCSPANRCPSNQTLNQAPLGDPFSLLDPPSTAGCGGGSNLPIGTPGTYPNAVSVSGNVMFAAGTYVFCNGISFTGGTIDATAGVFFYVAGGSFTIAGQSAPNLRAQTTGPYAGLLVWYAPTSPPLSIAGGSVATNYNGAIYAPNADVAISGNSGGTCTASNSTYIGMIVARRVLFSGTSCTAITGTAPVPGAPTNLTATTGPGLRQVSLAWAAPAYAGASPIIGYEYRYKVGAGAFGVWTSTASGTATAFVHSCGTSDTSATTCTYEVRAVNASGSGNPSNPATATSLADSGPPTVTITAPTTGSTVSGTVVVTGSATNAPGDATSVTVKLYNGANCTGAVTTRGAAVSGTSWTTTFTGQASGAKSVCVTQADWVGNVGSAGPVNFTTDATPPSPTNLTVTNGGVLGKVDRGDTVAITYSEAINPASMCTAWTGASRSSITVTITNNDAATGGNDSMTVTDASCTGGFNFGKVNLGSPNWVTALTSFSGNGNNASTALMGSANTVLTIRLGSGTAGTTVAAGTTMTYTPAPAITDAVGNPITGTAAGTNQRF